MNRLVKIAAITVALGFAASANAADMPARMPVKAAPMVAPAYNWSGLYVGVNGGGAWATESLWDNSGAPFPGLEASMNGGVFGGQLGYRYQWNQFVLGIEGTWDWANVKGSVTTAPYTDEFKIKSIYTVTGQAGWAWDRVLIYAKGGWAGAKVDADVTTSPDFGGATNSQSVHGWTVGGGLEFAATKNVTAGVEYDHFDFNYDPFSATWSTGGAPWIVSSTSRMRVDQVVGRISYKFDWMH